MSSASNDRVCVVIATYNRAPLLEALVASLQVQSHAAIEVVIVDNGSTDGTAEELERLTAGDARFRFLRLEVNRGPARARNLAWRSSDAAWIAFTDDDCRPAPDWLEQLLTATCCGAVVVQGRTDPVEPDWSLAARFDRSQQIHAWTGRYQTCNLLVAREVLVRLGGFNESFRIAMGEDTDLGLRAESLDLPMAYEDRAKVAHVVWTGGYGAFLRERWRIADLVALVRENADARRVFWSRWFYTRLHAVLWAAAPVVLVVMVLGAWPVLIAAVLAWCMYRAWRTRDRPEGAPRRMWYGVLELVAFVWEVACFLIASIRYRRVLL